MGSSDSLADSAYFVQSAIKSRLGLAKNTSFLEQFRYTIVASQLLNEHSKLGTYRRSGFPSRTGNDAIGPGNAKFSLLGVSLTGVAAFILAWGLNRLRRVEVTQLNSRKSAFFSTVSIAVAAGFYFYVLRQYLNYVRGQAIQNASSLVASAQSFNAAASSALALIQEVELVSRGYRMYVH